MKAKSLSLMAGIGASLFAVNGANAALTGVEVESVANDFGLHVCRVYATFDNPNDVLVAVAGTPGSPLSVEVLGGTFYNSPFGFDTAPNPALIGLFPELEFDSFVTIGKLTSTGDQTGLTPGWPGFSGSQLPGSTLDAINISWYVTPDQPQGQPVDGRVLIGQFSSADVDLASAGNGIGGSFLIQTISNGQVVQETMSFFHGTPVPGAGVLAVFGLAGMARRRRRV